MHEKLKRKVEATYERAMGIINVKAPYTEKA
jgi:hypothetical protein